VDASGAAVARVRVSVTHACDPEPPLTADTDLSGPLDRRQRAVGESQNYPPWLLDSSS